MFRYGLFGYYWQLALKSLKRNPALSTLMVLAIAIGIGACMTTLTVYSLMASDPIPQKATSCLLSGSTAGTRTGRGMNRTSRRRS